MCQRNGSTQADQRHLEVWYTGKGRESPQGGRGEAEIQPEDGERSLKGGGDLLSAPPQSTTGRCGSTHYPTDSSSLEEKHNCCALTQEAVSNDKGHNALERTQWIVAAKGCRCRYCSDCCETVGIKLRERVREVIADWRSVLMVTLTVDPAIYGEEGAEAAYRRVRERRAIGRMVRSLLQTGHLTSGRYFVVLEFQKNGYPHWHVLLETSFVPIERLQEVWDHNRPMEAGEVEPGRPGFGWVWVSKSDFQSMDHAANYATKYLTKHPEQGYPEWVLDFVGRVPKYSTSREFWGEQQAGERVQTQPVVCHCARCQARPVGVGVWKPVTLPQGDWDGFEEWKTHRTGQIADGFETREVWCPGEPASVRRSNRTTTLRQRMQRCGTQGVVLLKRERLEQQQDGEYRENVRWFWLGELSIPFAEYCEETGSRERRKPVTQEEAERLTGKGWVDYRSRVRRL